MVDMTKVPALIRSLAGTKGLHAAWAAAAANVPAIRIALAIRRGRKGERMVMVLSFLVSGMVRDVRRSSGEAIQQAERIQIGA